MNTLKTITLISFVAATLCTAAVSANELDQQVRAVAEQQQVVLYKASQRDARAALLKTAIELQARQSAEQFANELLAMNAAQPLQTKAE